MTKIVGGSYAGKRKMPIRNIKKKKTKLKTSKNLKNEIVRYIIYVIPDAHTIHIDGLKI